MEGFIKQKKGITLIALVITIVVLLILAGVTIATLMGDNGILTKANDAEVEQSHATVREALELAYNEWKIQINTSSNAKLASTETIVIQGKEENAESETTTTFFDFLVSKSYVDESTRIIDVEKLTGSKQTLGNGTGSTDVYILYEDDNTYKLFYCGESEEDIIYITTIAKEEEEDPFFYTQEDIDETLKYFTWKMVNVTEENREEYGYDVSMIGKTVAIITGTVEEYYQISIHYGYFPIKKIVIPSSINGSDYVDIDDHYVSEEGGHTMISCLGNIETIIYLNSFNIFNTANCDDLKNIRISKDVKILEKSTFSSCSNLEKIEVEAGSPLTITDFENIGIDPNKVIFK